MGSTGRRCWIARTAFAAVLLAAAGTPAPAGRGRAVAGPDDALVAAKKAAVTKLEEVATWCDAQRLFGARDRVFERILLLAPDHPRARAALKYTRENGARWVRRSPYTAPPDWNRGLVPKADERLNAAMEGYRHAVIASVSGEDVPLARRERALDGLVDLIPGDKVVRELRGDVLVGSKWKLPESVDGAKRRAELRGIAADARGAFLKAPPASERSPWTTALTAPGVALYSTLHASVGRQMLGDIVVADAVARDALGSVAERRNAQVLYVLEDRDQALALIARASKRPETDLAVARMVSGYWLADGAYVCYVHDPDLRTPACARAVNSGTIGAAMPAGADGFVTEGLGQRVLFLALGVHGPPFVTIEDTDLPGTDEDDPLPTNPREWMPRAARLLEGDGARRLEAILTARLNAMTTANVLVAYALAAYVLEARPDRLRPLVEGVAAASDAGKVVEEVFGGDVGSLAVRVRRYALECD